MSETFTDKNTKTTAATTNDIEQYDSSSLYHIISNVTRSSSDTSSPHDEVEKDKGEDRGSANKERLSKDSKKQAMGDICNSDDPIKSVNESTSPNIVNDNVNNQNPSETLKTGTEPNETNKMQAPRLSDEGRRRGNVFYTGRSRRGSVNGGFRSTYTSRDYWRPRSASGTNSSSSRKPPTSRTTNNQTASTVGISGTETTAINNNARNVNQRSASTESSKNTNAHGNVFSNRPKVTRTFHNGALRANRAWRDNVMIRSQNQPFASGPSAQSTNGRTNNSVPHVSNNSGGSRTADTRRSAANAISSQTHWKFPIIYVSPAGTISILLNRSVMIEVAVDRAVRIVCYDKFSAACNGNGSSSCILHKEARIFQQAEKVFCNFGSDLAVSGKAAVFGTKGVLFTMSHLSDAFLVSSTIIKNTLSVSLGRLQFPSLDYDFTIRMFFTESQNGDQFTALCNEIVQEARYGKRDDGTLTLSINGVYIKQNGRGDVEINSRPKHISCSPSDGTVYVRTNVVDMAVQEDDKAYVKKGLKRVHVSRSGMVVSDGNCITSMDHLGNIVSSA
uniref:ZP domain-containing protein n=1 Tax=Elaeophora elaphi TaxID=1147741 RepID=A0A0R3RPB4_9BILA